MNQAGGQQPHAKRTSHLTRQGFHSDRTSHRNRDYWNPGWYRRTDLSESVRKANEAAAVGTLNSIRVAQAKYVIDHKGQYGTFRQLFEEGYLDKRFNYDQPHNRGYVFVINPVPKSEKKAATLSVNANPEQSEGIGATGRNFYYMDPESGICFK